MHAYLLRSYCIEGGSIEEGETFLVVRVTSAVLSCLRCNYKQTKYLCIVGTKGLH